jgi:hypothetical protein
MQLWFAAAAVAEKRPMRYRTRTRLVAMLFPAIHHVNVVSFARLRVLTVNLSSADEFQL